MNLSLENPLAPTLPVACALMGVLGAMIGSFLNVVIHRLPREQSIVFPNSTCPKCHAGIKAYDNIPILSFLILRGQCRACGAPISPRYPAVEALTALLFVAVTWHAGWSLALGFDLAFAASILALIFIDAEHMILPNAITYPGIIFALITRAVVPYLDGLSMGKVARRRGHGFGRRKNDVDGRSISRLAANHSHDSNRGSQWFSGRSVSDVAARKPRPADDVAVRNFPGYRINRFVIDRHAHHRMVRVAISLRVGFSIDCSAASFVRFAKHISNLL